MYILSIKNYKLSIENSQYALRAKSQYYVKYSQYTLCTIFNIRYEFSQYALCAKSQWYIKNFTILYVKFSTYNIRKFSVCFVCKNLSMINLRFLMPLLHVMSSITD